ncbi:hypothetical protein FO519_003054 [Halicephalobus sp. NKZ332]|nr:hypothetical protein FO519_003054 [Halicephalobus sp. NKZ332]
MNQVDINKAISIRITFIPLATDDELYELIGYNATCLELLQKMINKIDRARVENMEAMEALHEQLATGSNKTVKKTKIPLVLYDKPYFKDSSGITPLPNSEAKEMYNSHKMVTLLREERAWSHIEDRKLKTGVHRSLLKNLNSSLNSRLEVLEYKVKNFSSVKNTEEERNSWRSEIESIRRKINYNNDRPVDDLFNGDYRNVDWREIAMVDLNGERSPITVRMRWCNQECPEINEGSWKKEEDIFLKNVACQSWTNWKFVAHELGTHRSEFMCICRAKELYTKVYREPQAWTTEEDEKLLSIVSNCRNIQSIAWEKVAKLMTSRTAAQCKIRFKQSLMQNLRHGRWTEAEDMFLLDAVNRYGPIDWGKISSCVPGRNEGQCRSRWTNFLDVKREPQPWTAEDDELLLNCVRIFGKGKWSELSILFENRNPVDLRGRYLHYVRTKFKEKKMDYGTKVSNQFLISMTRRSIILSRFHALETDDAKMGNFDDTYKRFGIGNFIVNPSVVKKNQDNVNRHIYQSGIYRKPLSKDERRKIRFKKFLDTLTEEQKDEINKVKDEIENQKIKKIEEAEKAIQENKEEEFYGNQAKIDAEKITKLMNEIVKVEEHDLKQMEKRRIPRIRIRRRYPRKPGRREDPEVTARKMREAAFIKDVKKKHDALRELPIFTGIADLIDLEDSQIKHVDGSDKRIGDLVLLEDHDGKPYWATTREESILNLILEVNKTLVRGSLYNYENFWRINSSNRCKDYFRKILAVDLPPVVDESPKEDSLEVFKDLLSDVMFPCRGTLTAVQQNRTKARQIYNTVAGKYFDSLDPEGRHVKLQENEVSTGRLDIRLNKNITNSEEYGLLKKRIFKMFFLPMLMEHGQRRRAPTGLYDRQHNDNILGTLRDEIRLEQQRKNGNLEKQPHLAEEGDNLEQERTVVKSEMMDGNE